MNVNEYGITFLFSTGFDMSSETSLSLKFTKPDASTLTVTNPAVAVGIGNITTTDGIFVNHQYVTYTFAQGDVDQSGAWSVRLTYTDATPRRLISDIARFTINP